MKEWAERRQVDEMNAHALLYFDSAFEGSRQIVLCRSGDDDLILRDDNTSTEDGTSRTGMPDTQNPTVTRPWRSRIPLPKVFGKQIRIVDIVPSNKLDFDISIVHPPCAGSQISIKYQ